MQIEQDMLLGKTDAHLAQQGALAGVLHRDVVAAFANLEERARRAGFDLRIASGYRSFERQLHIWNAKASGQRPVYDDNEQLVDLGALDDWQKLEAILRFSALPGASRHHWGTDLDVYDATCMPEGYRLQLNRAECCEGGPFFELHRWLDQELPHTGFYRPYARDTGGVSPEPWHLSYWSLASEYAGKMSAELLQRSWEGTDLALAPVIKAHLPALYQRFVVVN